MKRYVLKRKKRKYDFTKFKTVHALENAMTNNSIRKYKTKR